jgi:hypothetical protein
VIVAGPRHLTEGTVWYDLLDDLEIDVHVQHPKDRAESSQTIRVERSRSALGSVRYWFRCPLTGRRVAKLYLPPARGVFASRAAHGLAYRSQRLSRLERAYEIARRVRTRLGGTNNLAERFPPRPPRMHRRTYERLRAKGLTAQEVTVADLAAQVRRISRRAR